MKHLFIINPIAGGMKGRFNELRHEIEQVAEALNESYEIYVTTATMDACRKITEAAENEDKLHVYACGGDGTLNECVNGAAKCENVAITHYPCGTGNDFLKTFGFENAALFRDLKELTTGMVHPVDLIECDGRYGINICSVGVDARVAADVHKYSSIPIIGGATGYVVSLIVNIIKGVTQKYRITIDDKVIDQKITLACACNGSFYGGGFNPIPEAVPNDGMLDCLVVEPVSRLKVAQIVGRYAKGRFREFPGLFTYVRGSGMKVEGEREFVINIDGEAIYAKSINFKLIPNGINFIFPKKCSIIQ
jgi:YegS/Rv2252/BmrU family lipid kinase